MRMVREAEGQLPEDFKGLHEALVSTDSVEQFLHEMAVLAASAAVTFGKISSRRSTPVRASTRCTGEVETTRRIRLPLASARWNERTRALTPVESQNAVLLRSAISRTAP